MGEAACKLRYVVASVMKGDLPTPNQGTPISPYEWMN